MLSLRHIWIIFTDISHSLFGSPIFEAGSQIPIKFDSSHTVTEITVGDDYPGYPDFVPAGSNIHKFKCQYPSLKGWHYCGDSENQSCWLRNPETGDEFNIHTNYEDVMPIGVDRYYTLNVTDGWINADGLNFTEAKLFNNQFPGPLIEACWGDRVHIKVENYLNHNGTSIHWHGIRQKDTMHMDGVNGLTQCPVAPEDYFEYKWNATQYGSSWYHSHYSVQYADGLQAPITIHGPTSDPYDEAVDPIIITDWLHNSSFEALYTGVTPAYKRDILLGGPGHVVGDIHRFNHALQAELPIPKPYEIHFEPIAANTLTKAKRYLLRVISTSFDTSFIFSIDNHILTIVEADFVPVTPINTTSVLVAIGQRYHIIVEANPVRNCSDSRQNPIPKDGNFWIRTFVPESCGVPGTTPKYTEMGILRYNKDSKKKPRSKPWNVNMTCSDTEINSKLQPIVPWTVGKPANGKTGEDFNVSFLQGEGQYGTAFISLDRAGSKSQDPFQTNYGNPTFLNLENVGDKWPVGWVVVPENYTENDWVHLVLFGATNNTGGPHPIHLHGHDFAILQEVDNQQWSPEIYNASKNNLNNPARRDVVLLPKAGYVVIGFKTDNPGVWLMHCHIAAHAAGGLSLQIMERQQAANQIWPAGDSKALAEAHRVCANWNSWAYDCRNYWPGQVPKKQKVKKHGKKKDREVEMHYPACEDAVNLQNDSGV
ncbi:multicopper oxidase [Colletotrichum truncatum]|uniref:Multicopper oxidase n=1 Tax=Colletotrichum truncatum TaxID=5467 RepID=A0ACC3YL24_COLTU|nr:multicopper oxidase [Colletotrichum truncatum]KAF6782580.1 multicopper oxidase [Colletotrichum truncatum]